MPGPVSDLSRFNLRQTSDKNVKSSLSSAAMSLWRVSRVVVEADEEERKAKTAAGTDKISNEKFEEEAATSPR